MNKEFDSLALARRAKGYGHLAMLAATIIFGLNSPFSKMLISPEGISPYVHTFCRFTGGTILFWLVSLFAPHESIDRKDLLKLVGASLTGVLLNQGVFAVGISMTSPINQTLIATMGPVVTMLLAAFFLREPITWLKALGVAIGATGVLVLVFNRDLTGTASLKGDLICAVASFSYCLYLTLFKDIIMKYSAITLMKWLFLISWLLVLPIGIPAAMATPWASFDATFYLSLAFVVVFATFVAYFLLPIAQKVLRPTVVSIYNYGMPLIGAGMALMMGQDRFTLVKLIAALLILSGVYLVTKSKSRAQLKREQRQSKSS